MAIHQPVQLVNRHGKTDFRGVDLGHDIARHIQRTTDDLLHVEHGSLYPALHRLERRGWVAAKWEKAGNRNRQYKYYRLTAAGRKQLVREESKWQQLVGAMARLFGTAGEEAS